MHATSHGPGVPCLELAQQVLFLQESIQDVVHASSSHLIARTGELRCRIRICGAERLVQRSLQGTGGTQAGIHPPEHG
jgi:hypothetical protein